MKPILQDEGGFIDIIMLIGQQPSLADESELTGEGHQLDGAYLCRTETWLPTVGHRKGNDLNRNCLSFGIQKVRFGL